MPVNTQNAVAQGVDLGVSQSEYNRMSPRERAQLRRNTPGTWAYQRANGADAETRNLASSATAGVGRGTVVEQPGERAAAAQRGTVGYGSGQVDPRLAAAAASQQSAADAFTVGYGEGQVDPRLAAAVADQTTGTPSPSTMQATGAPPTGTTTPSLAGRSTNNFTTISPRPYFRIDPNDNRYDFLTGQKVNTEGGNPNINTPTDYRGSNTGSGGGTGSGGNAGSTTETFYNEFGDSYTQADIDRVEELRSFNESLGGGAASAELTAGERAYAISQGYIGTTTDTADPDALDPRRTGAQ